VGFSPLCTSRRQSARSLAQALRTIALHGKVKESGTRDPQAGHWTQPPRTPFQAVCGLAGVRPLSGFPVESNRMSTPTPAQLGPYKLIAAIGRGGMGEVYKARDTRLDRIVAIKVSKEKFSDRFEREARSIAALNHPHICQL